MCQRKVIASILLEEKRVIASPRSFLKFVKQLSTNTLQTMCSPFFEKRYDKVFQYFRMVLIDKPKILEQRRGE